MDLLASKGLFRHKEAGKKKKTFSRFVRGTQNFSAIHASSYVSPLFVLEGNLPFPLSFRHCTEECVEEEEDESLSVCHHSFLPFPNLVS